MSVEVLRKKAKGLGLLDKKFKDKSVYFTSLGCSKNLVDSEVMLGHLGLGGLALTQTPEQAEVIIINTCSFIEASKKESIDVIFEMADYKKQGKGVCQALVVSGCMAQRYSEQLEAELPEVDLIIGTGEYNKIVRLLKAFEEGKQEKKSFVEVPKFIHTEYDPRISTSPFYTNWLKISEGCNRNCTFCIIPTLRGRLRSRTVASLINEAQQMASNGVVELNLISQDLSDYATDLGPENNLYKLLCGLEKIESIRWIRLFYFYPDDLTDQVIEKMATSKKICKYLDMPIQHFSSSLLKKMNRKITGAEILAKIRRLREKIPGIVLRTSIIVGFPGEGKEDFAELLKGVEDSKFNHLGIFRYSDEEGTPAYKLMPKVPAEIVDERFDQLFQVQKEIARKKNSDFIGQIIEVLIEGEHSDTELLVQGRHFGQAPDIDGKVIINDLGNKSIQMGEMVKVKITEIIDFDLIGTII